MTNAQETQPSAGIDLDEVIGENVHRLMWRAKENQTYLAPLLGMKQASLSLKLRGKRAWFAQEIAAAANHFGVSIDALFGANGDGWAPSGSNRRPTD
jgi:hypothetical protein